jgi:hypothetical protein
MWPAALKLFFHMDTPMNKYHSCDPDDIQNSFPFGQPGMIRRRGVFQNNAFVGLKLLREVVLYREKQLNSNREFDGF